MIAEEGIGSPPPKSSREGTKHGRECVGLRLGSGLLQLYLREFDLECLGQEHLRPLIEWEGKIDSHCDYPDT